MRPESLFFELRIIFGVNVCRSQHHIDIVRGQSGRALGPVVDDLERNLNSFLAIDGIRLSVEPAVRHQAPDAADPHVHSDADFGIAAARRRGYQQRFARVYSLPATGGAFVAHHLAEIYDSVSI